MRHRDYSRPVLHSGAALLLATGLAACAAAAPRGSEEPLEAGRYTFDGEARVTHYYQTRQETSVINVSGVVDVSAGGDIELMSPLGACAVPGRGRPLTGRINISCGRLALSLGPSQGSARLRTQQHYEVEGPCAEFAVDAAGRSTGVCVRRTWVPRQRTIVVNVPLAVTRTAGGS
jgi:hypothetical protein